MVKVWNHSHWINAVWQQLLTPRWKFSVFLLECLECRRSQQGIWNDFILYMEASSLWWWPQGPLHCLLLQYKHYYQMISHINWGTIEIYSIDSCENWIKLAWGHNHQCFTVTYNFSGSICWFCVQEWFAVIEFSEWCEIQTLEQLQDPAG